MEKPWAIELLSLQPWNSKLKHPRRNEDLMPLRQAQAIAWQADPKLDLSPKQSPVLVFGPVSHL